MLANLNAQNRLVDEAVAEKKNTTDLVMLLDRLAAVFRFIQKPHAGTMNGELNDVRVASADAFFEVSDVNTYRLCRTASNDSASVSFPRSLSRIALVFSRRNRYCFK